MRVVGLAVAGLLLAQGAQAQDMLRGSVIEEGPAPIMPWSGVYAGGSASYVIGNTNFDAQTKPLIADILRNSIVEDEMNVSDWPVITTQSSSAHSTGYGGFIGFNTQWDEIVLGVDLNYMHTSYANQASGSITRYQTLSDGYEYHVTASGTSRVEVQDVVTARARAGYAYGTLLPYVTGGVALARASQSTTVNVSWPGTTPASTPDPLPFSGTETSSRSNFLAYGYALGAGIDMALLPNVFARAEYEYTYFTNIGTGLSNARVGLAMRF